MPEPEELNIDFSEPSEADLEEEAGFSGEGLEEEKTEEKVEAKETEEKAQEEKAELEEKEEKETEEETEAEEEAEEEEEEAEPESAKDLAEARAKELLEELEEGEEEEPEPEPTKEEEPSKPETPRMTKEVVARLLKRISMDELPEGEVIIGDTTINFREMAEDDPETFATNIALSGAIAEKAIGELLSSGQLVTRSQIDGLVQEVSDELNGFHYWLDVLQIHPDARKIKADKKFKDWIKDQPKHIRTLAASHNPEDTITFLNYYKEESAKAEATTKDEKDREKKKKKDDLHKHTARTKAEVKGADKTSGDKDDEQAGWELGGKQ